MELFGFNLSRVGSPEVDSGPLFRSIKDATDYQKKGLEIDFNTLDTESIDYYLFSKPLMAYRESGFVQNIVNAVADDATREGFEIIINDFDAQKSDEINKIIQQRLMELKYQPSLRDAIKFSRIYTKGSGLYYAVIAGAEATLKEIMASEPIPESIKKVEFINVLESPDQFNYSFVNVSDPTKSNYLKPVLRIGGLEVHESRASILINEFDADSQMGISIVDKIEPAIVAQDSGIKGASHILQRVGAVLFNSEGMSMKENTAATISQLVSFIKNKIKSDGAFGMREGDKLEMLSHSFSGIREVYDYVLDNLAGLSGIPKSKIIGARKAGVISGNDDDLINYFMSVEGYQSNVLQPEIRKVVDLLFRETDNVELLRLTGNKMPAYTVSFNPLWSLSEKEQAENRKIRAEADKIDIETGKSDAIETRANDAQYEGAGDLATPPNDLIGT